MKYPSYMWDIPSYIGLIIHLPTDLWLFTTIFMDVKAQVKNERNKWITSTKTEKMKGVTSTKDLRKGDNFKGNECPNGK